MQTAYIDEEILGERAKLYTAILRYQWRRFTTAAEDCQESDRQADIEKITYLESLAATIENADGLALKVINHFNTESMFLSMRQVTVAQSKNYLDWHNQRYQLCAWVFEHKSARDKFDCADQVRQADEFLKRFTDAFAFIYLSKKRGHLPSGCETAIEDVGKILKRLIGFGPYKEGSNIISFPKRTGIEATP